jgi:prepilin-type N-terminal cleavage/methylation domain-containing protein
MSHKRGFTLIELLATLAIAGTLMVSAMSVTVRLSRSRNVVEQAHAESVLETQLRSLFEADLAHAGTFRKTATGIALWTCAALDAKTLALTHLPSLVTYEIRKTKSGSHLVRMQGPTSGGQTSELVCSGVASIDIQADSGEKATDGWNRLPAVVSVIVKFEDDQRSAVAFTYNTTWQ